MNFNFTNQEGWDIRVHKKNWIFSLVIRVILIALIKLTSLILEFTLNMPLLDYNFGRIKLCHAPNPKCGKNNNDTSKWCIARISHKSKKQYHMIHNRTQVKCKLLVVSMGNSLLFLLINGTNTNIKAWQFKARIFSFP